jgi:hypothetical protein
MNLLGTGGIGLALNLQTGTVRINYLARRRAGY